MGPQLLHHLTGTVVGNNALIFSFMIFPDSKLSSQDLNAVITLQSPASVSPYHPPYPAKRAIVPSDC